jgi:hypothetical protein
MTSKKKQRTSNKKIDTEIEVFKKSFVLLGWGETLNLKGKVSRMSLF